MTTNPFAPPGADVADIAQTPVAEAPPLWNPGAAASWSLFFTPIFGAVLQMKNWQALGETEKAAKSKNWAIGCVIFFAVIVLMAVFAPGARGLEGLSRLAGLALLITWYYANGKAQQAYVLARFGKKYKRKGWMIPLLCGVAGLVGFVVVTFVLAFVVAMLTHST